MKARFHLAGAAKLGVFHCVLAERPAHFDGEAAPDTYRNAEGGCQWVLGSAASPVAFLLEDFKNSIIFIIISILLDAYMQCIYTMIVDITLTLQGQSFEWDAEKAASNFAKHGVAFPEACEVFFDPFFHLLDATAGEEAREAAIGYTENARLLFVVHLMRAEETIRIISARPATAEERKFYERE